MKENAASRAIAIRCAGGRRQVRRSAQGQTSRRGRHARRGPHARAGNRRIRQSPRPDRDARRPGSGPGAAPAGSGRRAGAGRPAPSTRPGPCPAASAVRAGAMRRGSGSRRRTATPGRSLRNPSAVAAADCACPPTSSTSTTGHPIRRAVSALLPKPLCPRVATPSKSPMDPSATQMSAPAAWAEMAFSRSRGPSPRCRG